MMSESAEGGSAASASTASIASRTLRSGAADMVRTLLVKRRPPLSSAASVKVPPISTPRRCCMTSDHGHLGHSPGFTLVALAIRAKQETSSASLIRWHGDYLSEIAAQSDFASLRGALDGPRGRGT